MFAACPVAVPSLEARQSPARELPQSGITGGGHRVAGKVIAFAFYSWLGQERGISCEWSGCGEYRLCCRTAQHFAGDLSVLGEQAAEEPIRFDGSEHC